MFSKEFERKQMKVNAYVMPECIGKMRKIAVRNSNWDLYYIPDKKYCMSIAKPVSGASNSVYGNLSHIYRQIMNGTIKRSEITAYGWRVLKEYGYNFKRRA